jgi:CheY-like chemotaxis protein
LQQSETRSEQVPSKRILIVDDNTDAADTLSMMLRLDGHETACAYGGQEALERIQLFAPQVVLLDIGLPGMDGYEVARQIRHMELGGGIRLIALTGYGQPEDRARALAHGFDEHLVKPIDPKALSVALAGAAPATVEER